MVAATRAGPAVEALPGWSPAAFDRYGGEEKKGLREGYHAADEGFGSVAWRAGFAVAGGVGGALKAGRGVSLFRPMAAYP